MFKPVSWLSEQTGLPSCQTGLPSRSAGLGFDLHPNSSPSPNKPFGKPKNEVSVHNDPQGQSNGHKREGGNRLGDYDGYCSFQDAELFCEVEARDIDDELLDAKLPCTKSDTS
jgi:hypothetical protein